MTFPTPELNDVNRPYWEGLADGMLHYQHCLSCDTPWLPPRERCPACLSDRIEWRPASGTAQIVSWVVYHRAYAPHLKERIPYNVAIVELTEGPRMLTNILEAPDGQGLSTGASVALRIEIEEGVALPRFALAPGNLASDKHIRG